MIHILINALAASAGGGLTYIRNVIPHIALRDDFKTTVLVDLRVRRDLDFPSNVVVLERETPPGAIRRFWFEQRAVRGAICDSSADVLLSTGNFALLNSPVPQIVLSRNSLYTSAAFNSDLRSRGDYRLWLDTRLKAALAKLSIRAADRVVAPTQAFAAELREWTGKPIQAVHHGFDADMFSRDQTPLPSGVQAQLDSAGDALRLLFVSHYNYYRNFETLIEALALIRRGLGARKVRLFLTCKLVPGANPGDYRPDSAANLVRHLSLSDEVVELGSIPYRLLHHLYRAADIYVTPAYAESFAHPLVEAMASGLPVVAADLPVHREICGEAALYFQRFSAQELADRITALASSSKLAAELVKQGRERSAAFSWRVHVDRILSIASCLSAERKKKIASN